jgi:dihydrofolate synthase / folylpolyglutamate synthase
MNKFKSLEYLVSLNVDKMHFGLQAITKLLACLGNPQNSYKTVLIAGTNGKGSTAAMIASVLRSAGYNVGLYTSPHLVDVRERIVVNGNKIPLKEFNRTISHIKNKMGEPVTYFEFLTSAAFLYFKKRKIDIAVLEVGLGGRLDATNVCRPVVSIITNIDFDHTTYLGNTLEEITREKAGIIKKNGICITAAKQKKVRGILENICLGRRAKFYCLGRDIKIKKQKNGLLAYRGLSRNMDNLKIPLKGDHQLANATLALAAIELCEKKGFRVHDEAIYKGLKETRWEARLEIIQDKPLFLLDGAHNPAGIEVLSRSLKNDFLFRRLILVFGALADKDYRRMLQKILPLASTIILTRIKTARAVPANDILTTVKKLGYSAIVTEDVNHAIDRALSMAGKNDLICATGSFYLAGEVKQAFHKLALYDNKNRQ